MDRLLFRASRVKKVFNRNAIFADINFSLSEGQSLVVTGKNGSGKTTLLKILSGLLSATEGTVEFQINGKSVDLLDRFRFFGFVSPYLQLYDEFTAWEQLDLFRRIRGIHPTDDRLGQLLERVDLASKKHELVRTFSSGMKQRLKYACALIHEPSVLVLDEPTANLDVSGKSVVREFVREQQQLGIVLFATNEPDEVAWSNTAVNLDGQISTGMK